MQDADKIMERDPEILPNGATREYAEVSQALAEAMQKADDEVGVFITFYGVKGRGYINPVVATNGDAGAVAFVSLVSEAVKELFEGSDVDIVCECGCAFDNPVVYGQRPKEN